MSFMKIFHVYNNLGDFISFSPISFVKRLMFKDHRDEDDQSENKPEKDIIINKNQQCPEDQKSVSYSCWQEMHGDIMEMIIKPLPWSTRMRMSVVCKSWRSLIIQTKDRVPLLPWLCVIRDSKMSTLTYYDFFEQRMLTLMLPEPVIEGRCCGSSKGWLVILKRSDASFLDHFFNLVLEKPFSYEILLVNPITKKVLQLPPLSSIPHDEICRTQHNGLCMINRIELSSSDPSKFIIGGIFNHSSVIAFCRPGDEKWTIFPWRKSSDYDFIFLDMIFSRGMFCVLCSKPEPIKCCTYNLEVGNNHGVSLNLIPDLSLKEYDATFLNGENMIHNITTYLVESTKGDYFVICRHKEIMVSILQGPDKVAYDVFKLEPDNGHLNKVQDLGDQAIYLMLGGSLCVSAKGLRQIRPNFIYFAEAEQRYPHSPTTVSLDTGMWSLSGRKDQRNTRRLHRTAICSKVNWFVPAPW